MTQGRHNRTALVLSGGGARAAYEAGVLKALRELLPQPERSPFAIYCGASGGALNAAGLALASEGFAAAVDGLLRFWSAIEVKRVYEVPPWGWFPGIRNRPVFDTAPLARTLTSLLKFDRLEEIIGRQELRALGITCSGYSSGQSVSFFQGRPDLDPWHGVQRAGTYVTLNATHVLASMAGPFLFPAVKLHREYFGDGSMRQCSPLSPAIRLGADRIVAISTARVTNGRDSPDDERACPTRRPDLADVIGHVFSGAGSDGLASDLARLNEVNRLLARVTVAEESLKQGDRRLRHIDLLVVQPSQSLDTLALDCVADLPSRVQSRLRSLGARVEQGATSLFGYLLFEKSYTRKLIDLGYRDTWARRGEIADFLGSLPR